MCFFIHCWILQLFPFLAIISNAAGNMRAVFSPSVLSDSATPWTRAHQASLSFTVSWSLLKLMSIELVMPSNHLILCHPLLLLPSVFSRIRVFSNESALCIRWPKFWSFCFTIRCSNEYSGPRCFHESHSYLPGDFPEAKSSWDFFSVTPPHPNALSLDKVNSSQ